MRAEVEEQAVAGAGLLPGVGALQGTEAVVVGEHLDDAAERAVGEQLAHGEEVAVVAAVVEGSEEFLLCAGEGDERARIGGAAGERLVDDDVLAGFERGGGELDVGVVGRADYDEIDGGVGEGLGCRGDDAGGGVGRSGGGGALGVADDDSGEFESRDGVDEGAVEDSAGEAVAEDCGADGFGGHKHYRRQRKTLTQSARRWQSFAKVVAHPTHRAIELRDEWGTHVVGGSATCGWR